MEVMYMSPRPPYPPTKGDQLIAWEQIKQLKANGCQVYLLTFVKSRQEGELIKDKLSPYCKEVILFNIHPIEMLLGSLKTIYNSRPIQVNLFFYPKVKKRVIDIYKRINPEIIHVQTARAAEYFLDIECPKCIDLIDALSLNMERRARSGSKWLKPIFKLESQLMKRYEKVIAKKFDQVMLVSESDKKHLNDSKIIVNPNGTFITKQHLSHYSSIPKEKIILFHGNMQYYPNVEAVVDFVKEVWPHIHEAYPEYQFYIAGKDPVKKVQALHGKENVVVTGFVDDLCSVLLKAQIGIYPMKSGTGMQNKIVESMACGIPTIASPIALQGIAGRRGDELICAGSNEEMISAVKRLIDNPYLQEKYAVKGQAFVRENYSWEQNCARLIQCWSGAVMNRTLEASEEVEKVLVQ
ncbi:group 1 glycosyl transferase [[Bacillus] enclensis]|uniref:Sugar transferase, PEP-CTERM/EpsH1 system associated n=1 Tax=[Bacillus] enclensis TaxID=1402860 RepID=A0A0V8HDJ5_9BACI|nr:glycosyltransferase family 4 protein [[Bacillus] enclensis]KSU60336.1 group 1 glycosyl transferase [[Bacillus] enclensis]SCC23273.1 sugar transferase, PEP-CTERM/EpsH1 system associated [[Bacillus] enclensis]